jgi:hypothetical protein
MTDTTIKLHGGGPNTPAGKARSAMNAVRHGLTARSVVLANEDPAEFKALLDRYIVDFAPETSAERDLVREMAACQWRLQRTWTIESGMFDMAVDRTEEAVNNEWENANQAYILATAWNHMADEGSGYKLLNRYETRLTRRYDKAITMLRQLKADRKAAVQPPAIPESEICETNSLPAFLENTVAGPEMCETNSVKDAPTDICETNSASEPDNYETNSSAAAENCETNPAAPANCETNSPLPSLELYKDNRWPYLVAPEYREIPFPDLPKLVQDFIIDFERIVPPHLRDRWHTPAEG